MKIIIIFYTIFMSFNSLSQIKTNAFFEADTLVRGYELVFKFPILKNSKYSNIKFTGCTYRMINDSIGLVKAIDSSCICKMSCNISVANSETYLTESIPIIDVNQPSLFLNGINIDHSNIKKFKINKFNWHLVNYEILNLVKINYTKPIISFEYKNTIYTDYYYNYSELNNKIKNLKRNEKIEILKITYIGPIKGRDTKEIHKIIQRKGFFKFQKKYIVY